MLKQLPKAAALLGSGAATALGYAAMASGLLSFLDRSETIRFLAYVPWQLLGVTCAKVGLDQLALAWTSVNGAVTVDRSASARRLVVPLSAAFAGATFLLYDEVIAFLTFITLVTESLSLVTLAELKGRGQFYRVAVANATKASVQFGLIIGLGVIAPIELRDMVGCFVIGSLARYLLTELAPAPAHPELRRPTMGYQLVAHQVLQYWIARADQLVVSVLIAGTAAIGDPWIAGYIFWSRFHELTMGVLITVGPLFVGRVDVSGSSAAARVRSALGNLRGALVWTPVYVGAAVCYGLAYVGEPIAQTLSRGAPFFAAAPLLLLVYIVTYSALRVEAIRALIRAQAGAALAGGIALALFITGGSLSSLPWLIPLHLVLVVAISLARGWVAQGPGGGGAGLASR